jgi:predicted ATP-grasp superfamily ATP-dependent carboligase
MSVIAICRGQTQVDQTAAMRRVLVTNAGRGSALAFIRSLGRRGYWVGAADTDHHSAGFYSRYTRGRLVHADPFKEPEAAIDAIHAAVRRWGIDLIVPVTDEIILPLAAVRRRFAADCLLALPDDAGLKATADKEATFALAAALGVPCARSVTVATVEEALAVAPDLGWPLVLKPRSSRQFRVGHQVERFKVAYAASSDELATRMATFEGRTAVLLQEYVAGEGQGVELLLHEGRVLAAFQHRRLREVPVSGGASSFRESVAVDPTLLGHASRILGKLRWTGLAMVEFKVCRLKAHMMEVNGRIWGSLPLAAHSGMDFPASLADLYLSGPPPPGPPDTSYRVGVRSRDLDLELTWIGTALRGKIRYPFLPAPTRWDGLKVAARLVVPRDGYDIVSRSDLRPGFAELARLAGKLPRKLGSSG